MSDHPLVTVGIPSFECERHVAEALACALAQTWDNLEVLVIDDASHDTTYDVVRAFHDPRLRALRNDTNLGAVANWNRVLAEAKGEYFKLLHSDDAIKPDTIERQVRPLIAEPGLVMASCRRRILDDSGSVIMTRGAKWHAGRRPGRDVARQMVRSGSNLIGEPSAVLVRTSVLREARGFDVDAGYSVDLDLWIRLLDLGDLYFDPEPLADFRVRTGQWSARLADRQAQDVARVLHQARAHESLGLTDADVARGVRSAGREALLRRALYAGLALRNRFGGAS